MPHHAYRTRFEEGMTETVSTGPQPVLPHPHANLTFLVFQHYKPEDRISTGKYLLKDFSFIIYRF